MGRERSPTIIGLFHFNFPVTTLAYKVEITTASPKEPLHSAIWVMRWSTCLVAEFKFYIVVTNAYRSVIFCHKQYWYSSFQLGWSGDFLQNHFADLHFSKLSGLWFRPVGCKGYWLATLCRKLKALLCDILMSEVAVSHVLKLSGHV